MKKLFVLLMLVFLLGYPIKGYSTDYPDQGFAEVDLHAYLGTTANYVTVAWDATQNATEYEIEIYSINRKVTIAKGTTSEPNMVITFPFQGIFTLKVRALNTESPETVYSDWSYSSDPEVATVNGNSRGWWVLTVLAPPGQIF